MTWNQAIRSLELACRRMISHLSCLMRRIVGTKDYPGCDSFLSLAAHPTLTASRQLTLGDARDPRHIIED